MIVYRYGALRPTQGFDLLLDQLRLAARYRNSLIEIELLRRAARDFGADAEELKLATQKAQRQEREASGLGWATYQMIEADVRRARATRTPRFRRFDGTGYVAASVQAGTKITTDTLRGAVQVDAPDHRGHAMCRLRVTSTGTVELPFKMHRPLPPAVHVVRCFISVDRIGTRWVYSLHFSLRTDAPQRSFGSGKIAVNFGWRRLPEGVRVAYAVADDGSERELVLPYALLDRFNHAESLRSLADETAASFLGDARRRTRERNKALTGKPLDARRREFAKLPVTDTSSMEHWARRDRHLYQWERDEYAGAMRSRDEIYRLWARRLAADFGEVVIEDFDIGRLIAREDPDTVPGSQHVRFLVAPSYLRQEIKNVFGERCTVVNAKPRTTKCSACGAKCRFDPARELTHRCERCGAEWDQDANNARNQLADVATK